jgi:hypothetical protein
MCFNNVFSRDVSSGNLYERSSALPVAGNAICRGACFGEVAGGHLGGHDCRKSIAALPVSGNHGGCGGSAGSIAFCGLGGSNRLKVPRSLIVIGVGCCFNRGGGYVAPGRLSPRDFGERLMTQLVNWDCSDGGKSAGNVTAGGSG